MKSENFVRYAIAIAFAMGFASHAPSWAGAPVDPDADYDRLDGTGQSGKEVNVIEWEGNLEIHVIPKGSTAGLGLKLDKKNKDRPVMVIAYRFKEHPNQVLTRRNILGITLSENFKVYKDPSENDYDKFIISDNGLSGQVVAFKTDPTPTNLYPEGPAVAKGGSSAPAGRAPASVQQQQRNTTEDVPPSRGVDENGTLKPFGM